MLNKQKIKIMETNKETREIYEAPVMETVEIKVEQGFQMSGEIAPASATIDPLKEVIK